MARLIVLTPRAGRWNHRYLLSDAEKLTEAKLEALIRRARRQASGPEFVAIKHMVKQSQSERFGEEILLLQDARLQQLSVSQQDQLASRLEDKISVLDNLIEQKIDWDNVGREALIELPELKRWAKEFDERISRWERKGRKKPGNGRKWLMSGMALGVLLAAGAWFFDGRETMLPDFSSRYHFEGTICEMLKKSSPCKVKKTNPAYLDICKVITDQRDCLQEELQQRVVQLRNQGMDMELLTNIIFRYQDSNNLDWSTFWGEELSSEDEQILTKELQITNFYNISIDDYIEDWSKLRKYQAAYEIFPESCRRSVQPPYPENLPQILSAVKSILKVIKAGEKSPCVFPFDEEKEPLRKCDFSDEFHLWEIIKQCEPLIDDDSVSGKKGKGYDDEIKSVRALQNLFQRAHESK